MAWLHTFSNFDFQILIFYFTGKFEAMRVSANGLAL